MTTSSETETETAVKERPIIFSGEMVRAILDGRKTQTRRIIKSQPTGAHCGILTSKGAALFFRGTTPESPGCDGPIPKCPYGVVGDRLWVRETWQRYYPLSPVKLVYRATDPEATKSWNPSIFMPRWASRITLEVTGVRVERLNSISEADCIAEGIEDIGAGDLRGMYAVLWDSINEKRGYSWGSNPFVWVICFRRSVL